MTKPDPLLDSTGPFDEVYFDKLRQRRHGGPAPSPRPQNGAGRLAGPARHEAEPLEEPGDWRPDGAEVAPPPPAAPARSGGAWSEPEDRGAATLSPLGEIEYVDDLIRPGRIVVVAAEEGAGKSYAITGELAIRVAVAGGDFAGTWRVRQTGPVLILSEMHPDDDYAREEEILAALGRQRADLSGRLYRLPTLTAAGGAPPLTSPAWRAGALAWLAERGALLLIIDTGTGATQIDPWGREMQGVYASLRAMLEQYPALAIVVLLHLKKPSGQGSRRISDVLGEWGRWNDVTLLLEGDGPGAPRTKITSLKRVRTPRRIVATKAGGLLIEPRDLDTGAKATKVPPEDVIAAIEADQGITLAGLAARLGVSKATADRYVKEAGEQLTVRKEGLAQKIYTTEGLRPPIWGGSEAAQA